MAQIPLYTAHNTQPRDRTCTATWRVWSSQCARRLTQWILSQQESVSSPDTEDHVSLCVADQRQHKRISKIYQLSSSWNGGDQLDRCSMGRRRVEVDHKRCQAQQLGTGEQRPLKQQKLLMKMLNWFTIIPFEGYKKHKMRYKHM